MRSVYVANFYYGNHLLEFTDYRTFKVCHDADLSIVLITTSALVTLFTVAIFTTIALLPGDHKIKDISQYIHHFDKCD